MLQTGNGEVLFILPHGDETIMCGTAVPVGHYMPLDINDAMRKDIEQQARLAIKALGLDNCAVNMDFIEKDGKAYIIELTGRVGANCLPELTGNYWGIDYYEMILATALGGNPKTVFDARSDCQYATCAQMLKSACTGCVKSIICDNSDPNLSVDFFISEGSAVKAFTNCNDAIGQVIGIGETLDECRKHIDSFLSSLKLNLV